MKWWHGGPAVAGEYLLPPTLTNASELLDDLGVTRDEIISAAESHGVTAPILDRSKVYCVNDRTFALPYAVIRRGGTGWLYLVEPEGVIEDDPDFRAGNDGVRSIRCDRARIIRREKPSRMEQALVISHFGGSRP